MMRGQYVLHADFGAFEAEGLEHAERIRELRRASLNSVIDIRCPISSETQG